MRRGIFVENCLSKNAKKCGKILFANTRRKSTCPLVRPPTCARRSRRSRPKPIWPRCPRWKCVHPATPSRPCRHSIIRSCCNPTVCRIICGCSRKSAARSGSEKNSGKKLNFMDKDYYETAEKLLSEEFALALQTTPDAMREQLHTAALA